MIFYLIYKCLECFFTIFFTFISNENEIPIFVCTLTLPFAPCPLHIYEPRYRLMLRRAIDYGSKQFGMCMYTEENTSHITEYGCLLEIKNYQFTRDGRAIISTFGKKRFKIVSSKTKDGYIVAEVEWVKDTRVETDQKREGKIINLKIF
jgi:Lon protease-like protein